MDKNCSNVSLRATRLLLEDNYESPICHGAINGNGSSTWWCCYPSSACASQTAGLYDRHQRAQRPGALRKRIRFACSEVGQRSRWGVCRGRTGNTGCGKPAARAGRDPSLGKHGGAATLEKFSRLSGCTEDWREICEIQHRRGQRPEIVAAHHPCPLSALERIPIGSNRDALQLLWLAHVLLGKPVSTCSGHAPRFSRPSELNSGRRLCFTPAWRRRISPPLPTSRPRPPPGRRTRRW